MLDFDLEPSVLTTFSSTNSAGYVLCVSYLHNASMSLENRCLYGHPGNTFRLQSVNFYTKHITVDVYVNKIQTYPLYNPPTPSSWTILIPP